MLLEIINLRVVMDSREILKDISLRFEGPGLYFILGPNGSGKSTLLRAMAQLIDYEGSVIINGRDAKEFNRLELVRTLGYVWQNPFYGFFEASVKREISFILKNIGESLDKMYKLVEFFGIQDLLERSPFTLSGGEAKRVCLLSVLVADQSILLLDEPETELDLDGLSRLIQYLKENVNSKLIIVATPNPLLAYKLRTLLRGIVLIKDGQIVSVGGVELLENDGLLIETGIVPMRWWYEPS
ncbi:MAG: energy-coupling factor ABC transporter ATP-binding protein [Candidatus Njordarchaeales archaeon]